MGGTGGAQVDLLNPDVTSYSTSNDVVPGLQLASENGGQSTRRFRGSLDLLTKVWLAVTENIARIVSRGYRAEALRLIGP